jgi:uncharacterized membrane protein
MLTNKTLIAGLGLVLIGVALLIFGPDKHDQWGGLIVLGGLGILGAKPAVQALSPHKEKRP